VSSLPASSKNVFGVEGIMFEPQLLPNLFEEFHDASRQPK
jgi:hypothetical protein